ncbi:MAG: hypothetical protein KGZ79_09530 [Dethiobacter sp.]|nr:hypothetical protein [Dethiobacter sp.]MBS4022643.1 hypothetical protein [Dethiobacter sp.]
MGLPVLFVYRDNGIAITTHSPSVTGGDLEERARGPGVPGKSVDGTNVAVVWHTAKEMIDVCAMAGGLPFCGQHVSGRMDTFLAMH